MKKKIQEMEKTSEEAILQSLRKLLNTDNDLFGVTTSYLHSGNLALDYIISGKVVNGGYPFGKVIEIFGPPSTGKTALIDRAGAEMQKQNGVYVVADVENRWNREFARINGVNVVDTISFFSEANPDPPSVEEFTINFMKLLDHELLKEKRMLFSLDSLAALTVIKEIEDIEKGEMKADQGRKAQKIHAAMRNLPAKIRKGNHILMVANHIIDNPNVMFSSMKHTPGGRAVPFQATIRVEMLYTKPIVLKGKERPIGVLMALKVSKNSETAPYGQAEIKMTWANGIDPYSGLVPIMVDLDIIKKEGNKYVYKDTKFWQSEVGRIIGENPELLTDPRWESPYFKSSAVEEVEEEK